jgi:hypothetical protein
MFVAAGCIVSAGLLDCNISPAWKVPVPICLVVGALSVKLLLGARAKAFEVLVLSTVHPVVVVQVFPLASIYSRYGVKENPFSEDEIRSRKLVFLTIFVTLVFVAAIHVAELSEPLSFLNLKPT